MLKNMKNIPLLAGSALLTTLSLHSASVADQVFNDDLIVIGSECVGLDCVNGESFGSDTIRLKENNLNIHFDDTSVGSFPSNDWRILINTPDNGGVNRFSIQDATSGRIPFTIRSGAPDNSIFVDSSGRLGVGTATPVTTVHSKNGNTPTFRLEQDTSSGFAAQTWDVAGNETSFFVRDATNGSTLPFRIRPGATSNSIVVADTGKVGMGTLNPEWKLHTSGTGTQIAQFESSDGGAVQVRMKSNSTNRRFLAVNNSNAVRSQIIFGDTEIKLAGATDSGANLWATISAAGIVTRGPDCTTPCDGVFDPDIYEVESIEEHAEYMWSNKHLPGVGPTSPDIAFNVTQKTAGILHSLEKAHIYIEQLHNRIEVLESSIVR